VTTTIGALSGVPGLLSGEQLARTPPPRVAAGAERRSDPLVPGGHCDPWNHVEAAMALTVTGYVDEAKAAYRWLANTNSATAVGSTTTWERVKDARLDTNVCAYVAAGLYHYVVATGDVDFAASLWPTSSARSSSCCVGNRTTARSRGRSTPSVAVSPTPCSPGRRRSFIRCAARWRSPNASARQARVGVERRPPGSRGRAPPRRLRTEERVRHGLVLPDLLGRADGRARGVKRINDGWERHVMDGLRRALRVDE
jgi:hypothetical protein